MTIYVSIFLEPTFTELDSRPSKLRYKFVERPGTLVVSDRVALKMTQVPHDDKIVHSSQKNSPHFVINLL